MTEEEAPRSEPRPVIRKDLTPLTRRYRGNPLLRRSGPPRQGQVHVYHFTTEDRLDAIAATGLRSRQLEEMSPARRRMETIFATSAPDGQSHVSSLFGYPDLEPRCLLHHLTATRNGFLRGNIILAIELDPRVAIVADALIWNEAARLLHFEDDEAAAKAQAQKYWDSRIPLCDYLILEPTERERRIGMPEVLVPLDASGAGVRIDLDRIRVSGILEDGAMDIQTSLS